MNCSPTCPRCSTPTRHLIDAGLRAEGLRPTFCQHVETLEISLSVLRRHQIAQRIVLPLAVAATPAPPAPPIRDQLTGDEPVAPTEARILRRFRRFRAVPQCLPVAREGDASTPYAPMAASVTAERIRKIADVVAVDLWRGLPTVRAVRAVGRAREGGAASPRHQAHLPEGHGLRWGVPEKEVLRLHRIAVRQVAAARGTQAAQREAAVATTTRLMRGDLDAAEACDREAQDALALVAARAPHSRRVAALSVIMPEH